MDAVYPNKMKTFGSNSDEYIGFERLAFALVRNMAEMLSLTFIQTWLGGTAPIAFSSFMAALTSCYTVTFRKMEPKRKERCIASYKLVHLRMCEPCPRNSFQSSAHIPRTSWKCSHIRWQHCPFRFCTAFSLALTWRLTCQIWVIINSIQLA